MVIHGGALVVLFLAVALARLGAVAVIDRPGGSSPRPGPDVREEVREPQSPDEYLAIKYGIV